MTQFITYQQLRDVAQDGDIVFVRGSRKSFVQSAIMFFTSSPISHCFITFWMITKNSKRLMLVEAQGGTKRRIVSCSFYDDRKMVLVKPPKDWGQVEQVALEKVGIQDYSMFTALYVGLRDFMWNKMHVRLPRSKNPSEICSEFVARVYGLPQYDVTPGQLLTLLTVTESSAR